MTSILLLALGILGQWLLGIALIRAILGQHIPSTQRSRQSALAELLGSGLIMGIGAIALVQFLWSFGGGLLGRPLSFALTGLGFVAAVPALRSRLGRRGEGERRPCPDSGSLARWCAALIVVLFLGTAVQAVLTPQRFWDERAMFASKALVFYQDQSIRSPDLMHPDFMQAHPRYPPLLPLAEAHVYALLGEPNDRWAKLIPPLLYLGLVLAFAGITSRHVREDQAWLFAALLATVPALAFWEYGYLSAQADAPMASFHGLSLLYLWDWLRNGASSSPRPLVLAGLAAGLALFTKDEGIALLAVDLIALALVFAAGALVGRGRVPALPPAISGLAVFAACVALIALPWFWFRRQLPTTTEMRYFDRMSPESLRQGLESLAWSVPHLLRRMFLEVTQWGLTWWLMLLAAVTRPRQALRPSQLLLALDVLGALAALLLAGMVAPIPVEEHLGGSSHRYLLQITPAALLFALGQWASHRPAGTGV